MSFVAVIPWSGNVRDLDFLKITLFKVRSYGGIPVVVARRELDEPWAKWAKWVVDEKLGATRARVAGIEAVRSPRYVFLDSDSVPVKIPLETSVHLVRNIIFSIPITITAHAYDIRVEKYVVGSTWTTLTNTCCITLDEASADVFKDVLMKIPDGIYAEMQLATHAVYVELGRPFKVAGLVKHYPKMSLYTSGSYEQGVRFLIESIKCANWFCAKYGKPLVRHDGLEITFPSRWQSNLLTAI